MLRALFVHRDLPFHGGVARSFLTYARYRNSSDIGMSVACFQEPTPEMVVLLKAQGVTTVHLGDSGYASPVGNLRKLLSEVHFDVVVCTSFKAYVAAKMASMLVVCRVLFWVPSLYVFGANRWKIAIFRALARKDDLVFISEAAMKYHFYPSHRGNRKVVYHGVEDPYSSEILQPYPREERVNFGIAPESIVLCYIAEFTECKDHTTLLRSFAALSQKHLSLHLLLIGTGDLFEETVTQANNLTARDRVHFLGTRHDARRLLGFTDIYVHTCRGEGFGLAVVEAMLASIPVVVSDEGALPEIVQHGETGLLFKAGDVRDLVAKIELLLNDAPLYEKICRKGRLSCLDRFPPPRFASEMSHCLLDEAKMSPSSAGVQS